MRASENKKSALSYQKFV